MATEVKMPQLGETVVEGTITRWLKQEGESVQADESLLEVSTDKVDSEIPAPASGTILKIHVPEGETVKVGTLLVEIGAEGEVTGNGAKLEKDDKGDKTESAEASRDEAPGGAEKAPAPAQPEEPAAAASTPEPKAPSPEASPPKEAPPGEAPAAAASAGGDEPRRAILSPLVRRLAGEHGIDLTSVRGTGAGGRITKEDVLSYVASRGSAGGDGAAAAASDGSAAPAAAAEPAGEKAPAAAAPRVEHLQGGEETVPVAHMRKAIADHMLRSHLDTARAWNSVEVDMGRIARLRAQAGPTFKEREGFSLTWMPFVCKAVTLALLKFPQVNSTWNGDGTVTRKHYVNLGIAVALDQGLIVPVIKAADGMNLVGLARMVRDLAQRARSKKLAPDDVQGGSFTITNPGPFGSIVSVPIINKGQTGILAVDAVTKRPVVVTDEFGSDSIAIRPMVFLSMSWDHRVIDGAEAAQFLSYLKGLLEDADFAPDLSAYLPSQR
ncbi:MAG: dihydrolipoamide acetyltransferase family protein [Actinomycetota bacterium]